MLGWELRLTVHQILFASASAASGAMKLTGSGAALLAALEEKDVVLPRVENVAVPAE